jgi:hypothetical protein
LFSGSVWFFRDNWILNLIFGFLSKLDLVFKLDIGIGFWGKSTAVSVAEKPKYAV